MPQEAEDDGAQRNLFWHAIHRVDTSRPVRAFVRYLLVRGNLSAGGVTISALVSLVALVTILTNGFRVVLGRQPELFDRVVMAINTAFPGLVDDGVNGGIIDPDRLLLERSLTFATIISVPVLVWTATNVLTGLRNSIRSMFGLTGAPMRPIRGKLWDGAGVLMLATAVLVSSLLLSATTGAAHLALDAVGASGDTTRFLLRSAAVLAAFVVDAITFYVLFRVAAKVRIPSPDWWKGALLGAAGWGLLRLAGTSLIGRWDNPIIASFAVLATLIIWLNLGLRWCLYTAAWTANPPHTNLPVEPRAVHDRETPNYVTQTVPETLDWPHHEVTGTLIPDSGSDGPRSP
ncbi:putative integral membrane protein [Serinicoccus hydrothermalis]|uniref:Putative integral membrane protein n=1 Tax=Serinicoccus hydrothermalis TaxID=1758689 RepID=A0A1B1N8K4_9MICO|nr:YihY/virulence factor BrkB family protein [Serinicoccus hydrothermalis]ANS77763.1 putative integral membrane protein [Serinicoccus hydrothermalis]